MGWIVLDLVNGSLLYRGEPGALAKGVLLLRRREVNGTVLSDKAALFGAQNYRHYILIYFNCKKSNV
jgi:hypothetical protein